MDKNSVLLPNLYGLLHVQWEHYTVIKTKLIHAFEQLHFQVLVHYISEEVK
jgi:hypothetical protein